MNYRHAYHAGNFADVMKHALLTRILVHLCKKPSPFRIIDTHAGIGLYDLASEEAGKTGEWRSGIGQIGEPLAPAAEELLAPWRSILISVQNRFGADAYPGSPMIAREMLRSEDRAIFIEKHPDDVPRLSGRFKWDKNIKVVHLDGWIALGGFIPPKERRGLVLIDPPFEEPGEFSRCADRLVRAEKRWPTGIYALWYPVKHAAEVTRFIQSLSSNLSSPTLRLELNLAEADGTRLAGSGLVVVNPPWTLADEARILLAALAERFGGTFEVEQIVRETA